MTLPLAPLRGVPYTLQLDATTGNGLVIAIPHSFKEHRLSIIGSSGIAAGAVQPESANSYDYAGTWAPIGGGPVTVVASAEIPISFEGLFSFLRVRISTDIVTGTVTVVYQGN